MRPLLSLMPGLAAGRDVLRSEQEERWPAGNGIMRRPLEPLPDRPNPTDPGDAADLSTP
jgi:hypothetical protein